MQRQRWNTYSLKEHQDQLRVVDNERRREVASAFVLALFAIWREVQRRLDGLNHAHEQAIEVQHTYVTDEKFGDFVERYASESRATAEALTLAKGQEKGADRSKDTNVIMLTIVLAASAIGVTLFVGIATIIVLIVLHA